jgi:hypothetical protein
VTLTVGSITRTQSSWRRARSVPGVTPTRLGRPTTRKVEA